MLCPFLANNATSTLLSEMWILKADSALPTHWCHRCSKAGAGGCAKHHKQIKQAFKKPVKIPFVKGAAGQRRSGSRMFPKREALIRLPRTSGAHRSMCRSICAAGENRSRGSFAAAAPALASTTNISHSHSRSGSDSHSHSHSVVFSNMHDQVLRSEKVSKHHDERYFNRTASSANQKAFAGQLLGGIRIRRLTARSHLHRHLGAHEEQVLVPPRAGHQPARNNQDLPVLVLI